MKKLSKDTFINFLNARSPQEKVLILIFGLVFVLFIDTFLLIKPTLGFFSKLAPELAAAKLELQSLKQDTRNRGLIEKQWRIAADELIEKEKNFIASNEIPAMLENLSKLALDSKVRIMSLKPVEASVSEAGPYRYIPIRISAIAGTHDLGKFLANLETGRIFFRVTEIEIKNNPTDKRRHLVELVIEAYRKG